MPVMLPNELIVTAVAWRYMGMSVPAFRLLPDTVAILLFHNRELCAKVKIMNKNNKCRAIALCRTEYRYIDIDIGCSAFN